MLLIHHERPRVSNDDIGPNENCTTLVQTKPVDLKLMFCGLFYDLKDKIELVNDSRINIISE